MVRCSRFPTASIALVAAYALALAGMLAGALAGAGVGAPSLCATADAPTSKGPPGSPWLDAHPACCVDCAPPSLEPARQAIRVDLVRSEPLARVRSVAVPGTGQHSPFRSRAPPASV